MLAGDGDVRVHDLRPRFSRREISLGAYTMQSGSKVVVRVSDASWARLCHLGHVLGISPVLILSMDAYIHSNN